MIPIRRGIRLPGHSGPARTNLESAWKPHTVNLVRGLLPDIVDAVDGAAQLRIAVRLGEGFHQAHVEGGPPAVAGDLSMLSWDGSMRCVRRGSARSATMRKN